MGGNLSALRPRCLLLLGNPLVYQPARADEPGARDIDSTLILFMKWRVLARHEFGSNGYNAPESLWILDHPRRGTSLWYDVVKAGSQFSLLAFP